MAKCILGIDEVGRGPWAGPLVVGAVILGSEFQELLEYKELRDSKKITKKKREKLAKIIQGNSKSWGLGSVTAAEIDHYGLGSALKLAARRAVKQVLADKIKFDHIIIDGSINLLADTPLEDRVSLLPKADDLVKEVSAASIIAKVSRDQYMYDLANVYPAYGFEKHVGYGTKMHREALENCGICPEHRQSFRPIAKIITKMSPIEVENLQKTRLAESKSLAKMTQKGAQENETGSTAAQPQINPRSPKLSQIQQKHAEIGRKNHNFGHQAELSAASYLCQENHQILAQNYKTKSYEIDIISIKDGVIYFTEVKYHKNAENGDPLERITSTKLQKMRYAAEKFLQTHPEFRSLEPRLTAIGVTGEDFAIDGLTSCN